MNCGDGVADLVDQLGVRREEDQHGLFGPGQKQSRRWDCTFHLSGIPVKASARPDFRVFWIIADVMATPQTLPRERIRYTVDAETAWSAGNCQSWLP